MFDKIITYFFPKQFIEIPVNESQGKEHPEKLEERIKRLVFLIQDWGLKFIQSIRKRIEAIKLFSSPIITQLSDIKILKTQAIVEEPSEAAKLFGESLVKTGKDCIGKLRWFNPTFACDRWSFDPCETPPVLDEESDYGHFCLKDNNMMLENISSLICYELYGYLLLITNQLKTPNQHKLLNNQIITWKSLPENMNDETTLYAGDMIFMNGSNHVVIATGNKQEVLSLWNKPKTGVCLTTIQELKKIWSTTEKIIVHRTSITDIHEFLKTI